MLVHVQCGGKVQLDYHGHGRCKNCGRIVMVRLSRK